MDVEVVWEGFVGFEDGLVATASRVGFVVALPRELDERKAIPLPIVAFGLSLGGSVPGRCVCPAQGQAPLEPRALLGGRYADRGLGLDEELPAQGRRERAAVGWA